MTKEILAKIKDAVHQPLNWDDYSSTEVQGRTNCFSHAIGSTLALEQPYYRLGAISEKKEVNSEYDSDKEIKDLFLSDASELALEVEEITVEDGIPFFLKDIVNWDFADNEYVVALFAQIYPNGKIWDFHFLRYDPEKGWTEKNKCGHIVFFESIKIDWPSAVKYRLIGIFKVRR